MQVSIEATSNLERRLTVEIPAERFDGEVNRRLQQATKTVRINGFRKGKVPLRVVKQRFGASVRQEVMGELISSTYQEAVQQESVKPAGYPQIEPTGFAEGKGLTYVATFEVYPDVTLGEFSGFTVEKLHADVADADIDKMIDTLRKQQASWNKVERAAADGDQVNIDFDGTKDGEAFDGGSAQGQNLVLGSGQMIPGFESGLEGVSAGEEKTLSLTFPEDYHAEELKGAAVEFKVTVNHVEEQVLPELNEELFEKFGVESKDVDAFRADVKANMERELKNATKNKIKTQVMDQLVDANNVEIPKALISGEIDALRKQTAQQFGAAAEKIDLKTILPDDMFQEQAERRVKLGLLVGEIVNVNEIKVDQDRVKSTVEEIASTYQEPEEVVSYYYGNEQLLSGVESVVLEDQVVDFVLEKAQVTEKNCSYDEVVKPADAAE